jgi:hypothetical protein
MTRKQGYERGKGVTFTPTADSDWIEDFNKLLFENEEYSRNRLTGLLIKEGLKAIKGNKILFDISGLEEHEIEFLKSERGQTITKNLIKLILNEGTIKGSLFGGLVQTDPKEFEKSAVSKHKETDVASSKIQEDFFEAEPQISKEIRDISSKEEKTEASVSVSGATSTTPLKETEHNGEQKDTRKKDAVLKQALARYNKMKL